METSDRVVLALVLLISIFSMFFSFVGILV